MKSRLAIVYAADEGAYTDDKRLDLVAETMALQLIQPQPNSNVDLYRYHIFEKQITVKVNLTAEITTFSHSKINQWSQDVTLAMKTITDFLPFVTTSLTNGSYDAETTFGIVLLVKHRSQTSSVLRSIFKFDHTFLKGVNLYVVDVGGSSESLSMDYQDTFPTAAKYADLWDVHNVATYSMDIFRDICPGKQVL